MLTPPRSPRHDVPLPGIYPDQMAPVARINSEGERVIESIRWGFPSPPNSREKVMTNARRLESPWWRPWLKPEYRCLVPATSFCEYQDGTKVPNWFAPGPDRPLFAFAGIWRPVMAARGTKAERMAATELTGSEVQEHLVFAFVTTEPNELVRPVHAKAMPVILTGNDCDTWLQADTPIGSNSITRLQPTGCPLSQQARGTMGRPDRTRRYSSWRIFAALSIASTRSTRCGAKPGLHITT
jgi:putative SOS response-associated peptidase YedK